MRPAQTDSFWEQNRLVCNSNSNKDTTLNVKENAVAMLGQVQSHLADVEGKLKKAEEKLAQQARDHRLFRDERALYINFNGTMSNTKLTSNGNGPAREVTFEQFDGPRPGSLLGSAQDYSSWANQGVRHTQRRYLLQFSQGALHVYREV